MAGLDDISLAVGELRTDVRYIREKLDHTHDCLHQGAILRIANLENNQAYERGKAAGIGFIGGTGALALWKGIAVIAAKLGWPV